MSERKKGKQSYKQIIHNSQKNKLLGSRLSLAPIDPGLKLVVSLSTLDKESTQYDQLYMKYTIKQENKNLKNEESLQNTSNKEKKYGKGINRKSQEKRKSNKWKIKTKQDNQI